MVDKKQGEMVSIERIKGVQPEISEVNQKLREEVDKIFAVIQNDEERHTAVKNGAVISQEDVLTDFVNNHSNRLIKFN